MPIWGDREITWRQVLPPTLAAVAAVCLVLAFRGCVWPQDPGLSQDEQLAFYLRQLDSGPPERAVAAIRALGSLGDRRAVEPLLGLLAAPHLARRQAAVDALGRIGEPAALEALERLQADPAGGLAPRPSSKQRAELADTLRNALAALRGSESQPTP